MNQYSTELKLVEATVYSLSNILVCVVKNSQKVGTVT